MTIQNFGGSDTNALSLAIRIQLAELNEKQIAIDKITIVNFVISGDMIILEDEGLLYCHIQTKILFMALNSNCNERKSISRLWVFDLWHK